MNPRIFFAIVVVFCELVATAELSACNRCGIFGRGCRFAHAPVHHAPAAIVKAPDTIQNFVFNNIAPPGDLSPRGETVYGVARALEYNSPNSALYLDNVRRALEFAGESTISARTIDSLTLDAAQVDARGRAVEAAFRSLAPDSSSVTRSTSTRVTIKNGIPQIDDEPAAVPRGAIGGISCMKCHAADGSAAKRFVIDDTFDIDQMAKAKAAIESGDMPPKSNLTEAEKLRLVLQLGRLVPAQ
jgi:hypothetical protein